MVPNPLWIQCCHCELWMHTSQASQGLNAKGRPSMILQHDSLRQSLAFNNLLIVPWYSWHFTTIGLLTLGFPIVNYIVEYTNSSHHWFTMFTLFPLRDHAIQSFEDENVWPVHESGEISTKTKNGFWEDGKNMFGHKSNIKQVPWKSIERCWKFLVDSQFFLKIPSSPSPFLLASIMWSFAVGNTAVATSVLHHSWTPTDLQPPK